jgi:hypothetical protein
MALISVIVSCWSMWCVGIISNHLLIAIDEIFNWILFATLFYLLTSSMPLFLQKGLIGMASFNEFIGNLWLRLKTIPRR